MNPVNPVNPVNSVNPRWLVGASGGALLVVGWLSSVGVSAGIVGLAGLLVLAALVALRRFAVGSALVAVAFIAQVALTDDPNWALVVVGTVLLAAFLALSEAYHNALVDAGWPMAMRAHRLPVVACAIAAVLVAVVGALTGSGSPISGVAVPIGLGLAGAACVAILALGLGGGAAEIADVPPERPSDEDGIAIG